MDNRASALKLEDAHVAISVLRSKRLDALVPNGRSVDAFPAEESCGKVSLEVGSMPICLVIR
jgi:hypothetical protein